MTAAGSRGRPGRIGRIGRIGRRVLRLAASAGATLLVLLALAALGLALAPVRGALLGLGVGIADRALPGGLSAGSARWPRPGTIELRDVVWRADPGDAAAADTLLHARRLLVVLDAGALRRGDVDADSLAVDLVAADVPGLAALFPPAAAAPDSAAAPAAAGGWTAAFPREGSVPGLPSVAVRHVVLAVGRAVLAPDLEVAAVRVEALADLHPDRLPQLDVRRGRGRLAAGGASPFSADLAALVLDTRWDPRLRVLHVDTLAAEVTAAGPPAVVERWRGLTPLVLRGHGRLEPGTDTARAALTLRLEAPGAPLAGEGWPAALPTAEYATVSADLVLAARATADSLAGDLDLRLAAAPGGARLVLAAAAEADRADLLAGRVVVDTLAVDAAGIAAGVAGAGSAAGLDASVTLGAALPLPVVSALVPGAAGVVGRVDLAGRVAGPPDDPRLDLRVDAGVSDGPVTVRRLVLTAAGDRRDLRVALTAAGAVAGDSLAAADTVGLKARLRPAAGGRLGEGPVLAEADLSLVGGLRLQRGRAVARAVIDPAEPRPQTIEVDTLDLAVTGLRVRGAARLDTLRLATALTAELASPCPLLEALVPGLADGRYAASIELAAAGTPDDPRLDLRASGGCDAPLVLVPRFDLHAAGDRRDLGLVLRAGGGVGAGGRAFADSVRVDAGYRAGASDGLPLRLGLEAGRAGDRLGLVAAAGADSVATIRLDTLGLVLAGQRLRLREPAIVRLDTAARRVDVEGLRLAGDPGRLDVAGTLSPALAQLHAVVDLLFTEDMLQAVAPAPVWSEHGGFDLAAKGQVDLDLGATVNRFAGGLDLEMRPHRDDPHLGASLDFRLVEGDSAGLEARFTATAADTAVVSGTARLPGRYDLRSGRWTYGPAGGLEVRIPEQTVPMGLVTRLLPPQTGIRGALTMAADVQLPLAAPVRADADATAAPARGRVDGVVHAERLLVDLPNNSRLEMQVDCRVTGAPADPRLAGRIRVPTGFIRIPELPRSLHAAEGSPALWSMAGADPARADSLALPGWTPPERTEPPAPFLPDLDLAVEVPNNLRIRGYGLDVEVGADVRVNRGQDARGRPGPALHGQARAVRGSLKFMNRTFDIRQAEVTFTGAVPPDPELDLLLEARVSGTIVRLRVTGRASDPVIDLTSEPDLQRADIVAVLLFGRPLNDLDADQRGRTRETEDPAKQLQENLAGLALAFGTADLQNTVSGTLGVDIVEVGSDSQGGSVLTAGKFLSPRILLKYNASLEKSGTYFVTLEYTLTEVFRIVTTYGQGEEASGLDLKWLRRY